MDASLRWCSTPPLWHRYSALLLLVSQPARELSAPDLERELSPRQYQVSRLVEGLAEGGLVTRRRLPVAGRTTLIRLTGRGLELQRRMAEALTSVVDAEVVGQFPEQESTILVALLGRFCQPYQAV
jgi:DNA-binding MarR family transcriptional regulator